MTATGVGVPLHSLQLSAHQTEWLLDFRCTVASLKSILVPAIIFSSLRFVLVRGSWDIFPSQQFVLAWGSSDIICRL